MRRRHLLFFALAAAHVAIVCLLSPLVARGLYASYADVAPVLAALTDILPPELRDRASTTPEAAWTRWAARHDREIRERLARGDQDTLVNWLLLGSSFTSHPRVVPEQVLDSGARAALIQRRIEDLLTALQAPGEDERRLFAKRFLEQAGHPISTVAKRERTTSYLLDEVARVAREQATYARDLAEARQLGDTTQEFAARSRLFRTRGLSLDTSLLPGFALERTLAELKQRGLVREGAIHEVAVVGPGLDFSDKSSGYDFYPQQTLQPFTLVDSLIRAGLVDSARAVRVTTLDLSPRVNEHLSAVRRRATEGGAYVLRLPLDLDVPWKPDVLSYWTTAGDRVGATTSAGVGADAGARGRNGVRVRSVAVPPAVVERVQPEDLNIVVELLRDRRFDLVVATNVFVYYDTLDQVLALSNVSAMLRPQGILLSNNALLELPGSKLRSAGYLTVQYSDRPDDGDHIVWYRRMSDDN